VWKDEHEQAETKTAISIFNKKNLKNWKTENRNRGFGMKKTEPTFKFPNCCITNGKSVTELKLEMNCQYGTVSPPYGKLMLNLFSCEPVKNKLRITF